MKIHDMKSTKEKCSCNWR